MEGESLSTSGGRRILYNVGATSRRCLKQNGSSIPEGKLFKRFNN
jgi:hypothetical protein